MLGKCVLCTFISIFLCSFLKVCFIQLYDIKDFYIIQITCTQFYGFKYPDLLPILIIILIQIVIAQSAGAVEYTDYTCAEGYNPASKSVLDMTVNYLMVRFQ